MCNFPALLKKTMLNKYLNQTEFSDYADFMSNFKVNVPENFNFGYDVVDEWARIEPNKKALCWVNDQGKHIDFTFTDVKRESDKAAAWLLSLGIKRGDIVMLMLKRRYEFWFSIIALHKIGATCIPATHLLTDKDIIYRCNAADIKMIISTDDKEVTDHIDKSVANSPTLKYIAAVGNNVPEGWLSYNEGVKNAPEFVKPECASVNSDISILFFTSGTTAHPKMVIHDYTYPLGHIITARYWHNLNNNSLHLTLADTGWAKAAWGKIYGQWLAGANIFVYDFEKFSALDLLVMIEKHKITSFCAPPTVFRFLIREDLSKFDISSLKYCTIAGEALSPQIYEEFYKETGIKLMEGFGQSESTLIIGTYPTVKPKPGSMGVVNPQYDVDIINENGESAAINEEGQIVIRIKDGKLPLGLFNSYYKDKEKTAEVFKNGYYYTGDIAYKDEDGYFWFIGRNDDVIKSSGYRIGPFEVESALMTHPAVMECAITGVPDKIRGQLIKASIILTQEYRDVEDKEALIKEIQNHVKNVTAPYKYPRVVEFVEELPKTISGKVRRTELRKASAE